MLTNHLSLILSRGEGMKHLISYIPNNRGLNIFFNKFIFNFFVFLYSLFQKPSPNALSLPNGEGRGGV